MKKISPKRRLWLIRSTRKRTLRHLKRKKKRKYQKTLTSPFPHKNHSIKSYVRIQGPKILGIYGKKTRRALIKWIQYVRQITLRNNQKIRIDFRESSKAESFGFLRMTAQLHTIIEKKGKGFVKATLPKDPIAAQVFEQTGLSAMLGIKIKPHITDKDVIYWNHAEGSEIEGEKAGILIQELAERYGLSADSSADLFSGVSEAITNTIMHAYDTETEQTPPKRTKWWMFAGIKDDSLHFLVCDIGMGIPASLKDEVKHPNIFGKVLQLMAASESDSKLIELAMESGRSKSKSAHRGLGMAELKKFINSIGQGNLKIMSSKGVCSYDANDGKLLLAEKNYRTSIMGTTIGWNVPMSAFEQREKLQ